MPTKLLLIPSRPRCKTNHSPRLIWCRTAAQQQAASNVSTNLNASSTPTPEVAGPRDKIAEGGVDMFCIAGAGGPTGDCEIGVPGVLPRACAGLVAGPEPVPAPTRRLRGTAAGIARPFLLTHTIKCMPTQNSARESLLSPSASESSQICRKCCTHVARSGDV